MAFINVEPDTVPVATCTVQVTKTGRYRAFALISLRAELHPTLDWWRPGAMVRIEWGEGEDAGKIRCSRNGPFPVRKTPGNRPKDRAAAFPVGSSALATAMSPDGKPIPRTAVDIKLHDDGSFTITLPKHLARPAPAFTVSAAPPQAATAASPTPWNSRFVGNGSLDGARRQAPIPLGAPAAPGKKPA